MDMKPPAMLKLGGGALMFLGAFFDWFSYSEAGFSIGFSGTETAINGFQGIFVLLIGLAVGVVAALTAFAPQVSIPESLGGFAVSKLLFMLSIGAFLLTFGALFFGPGPAGPGFGLFMCVIGAALAVVGYFLSSNETSSAPATSF